VSRITELSRNTDQDAVCGIVRQARSGARSLRGGRPGADPIRDATSSVGGTPLPFLQDLTGRTDVDRATKESQSSADFVHTSAFELLDFIRGRSAADRS
jgi:hypothetical protein